MTVVQGLMLLGVNGVLWFIATALSGVAIYLHYFAIPPRADVFPLVLGALGIGWMALIVTIATFEELFQKAKSKSADT